jgi:hypothetical protein
VLHRCALHRNRMRHFVNNLSAYLMFEVGHSAHDFMNMDSSCIVSESPFLSMPLFWCTCKGDGVRVVGPRAARCRGRQP